MRLRSTLALPAILAYVLAVGLAISLGCAGSGNSNPGTGGSSPQGAAGSGNPGTAGSGSPGTAGSASPGTAGSASGAAGNGAAGTGVAGMSGPGVAGTNGGPGVAGAGGSGPAGASGGGNTTGSAGVTGAAGGTGAPTDGGTDAVCQMAQYMFEPKIPTVYLLVDRSGSMFHCLTGNTGNVICDQPANTAWSNLREAVRSVVKTLDKDVRFGFSTIWGTAPSATGGMCPSIQGMVTDNVAPAVDNATAIMTKYDALQFPPNSNQVGVKFESPTSYSIKAVTTALTAITSPGDKYIIFITDGQPDYCDDSNSLCAPDSVIGQIQAAKTAGITTIVLGVQTTLFDLPAGILKAYATAGAGEPTVAPLSGTGATTDFYDQCNGIAGWKDDLTASGKPNARGTTLGAYSATAGPTVPYMPNAGDQTQLVTQLSTALAGVKSCTFDLNDVGGKSIKVDPMKLDQAKVKIEGAEIPQNATNGWSLGATSSELVLNGTACTTWRMPNKKVIDFNFPCGIIIFE